MDTRFSIPVALWSDDGFARLRPVTKTLFLYLITGPHANEAGTMRLPVGYMVEDMGGMACREEGQYVALRQDIEQALSELVEAKFIEYHSATKQLVIVRHQALATSGPVGPEPASATKPGKTTPAARSVPKATPAPTGEAKKDPTSHASQRTEMEEKFFRKWNAMAAQCKILPMTRFTAKRSADFARLLKDPFFAANWERAIDKLQVAPHCNGVNESGWIAGFDFFMKMSNFIKIMEGNYDPRPTGGGAGARRDPGLDINDAADAAIRIAKEREAAEATAAIEGADKQSISDAEDDGLPELPAIPATHDTEGIPF